MLTNIHIKGQLLLIQLTSGLLFKETIVTYYLQEQKMLLQTRGLLYL